MLQRLNQLIRFYFSANTLYDVHSPFVFDFCEKVLEDKRQYYAFFDLAALRSKLLGNHHEIDTKDLGAGSKILGNRKRKISQVLRTSGTNSFFAKLLFRMVVHYRPKNIVELGSSLGIGTLYLAKASTAPVYTVEGCPNTASWANRHYKIMKASNIHLQIGDFGEVLPELLDSIGSVDFLFVDGNHRYQPTMDYFCLILEHVSENSIIIFDDIYWSEEMVKAWNEIKKHDSVTQTIDLFQFGIVFFRKDFKHKKHWKLVPKRWKPWRIF